MESIKTIYKIGHGPSSSHTMGPRLAAELFKKRNPNADKYIVDLYASLALTGRGHLTDKTIKDALGKNVTVNFLYSEEKEKHANALEFKAYKEDKLIDSWLVYSIGGGDIRDDSNIDDDQIEEVYPLNSMGEILTYCDENHLSLLDYILKVETDILDYLEIVFKQMIDTVNAGLSNDDVLPGKLQVARRAKSTYLKYLENRKFDTLLFASALASSEENASGAKVVTAPTCGSCGVIAGIVYSLYKTKRFTKKKLIEGLAIAGLIGLIVKTNASISGAEVGCQGEVGTACTMASGMITYLKGGNNNYIEYASEIALEHHLGMTCDPIMGYVQIPCIERNAIAARQAFASAEYALLSNGEHHITLDMAVKSMMETGLDLRREYKETALGGLAKVHSN